MKANRIRSIVAIGAGIALTLAACGSGNDAAPAAPAPAAPAPAEAGDTVATSPTSIEAGAQESDGTSVVVARIDLPSPGFIAIHGDGGGNPGPVIGNSALLPAGLSLDVVVPLSEPLTADSIVFPMAHIDIDNDGVYDFAPPDETTDGPGRTVTGDVAVVSAAITIGGSEDASGTGAAIDIENFKFAGDMEVSVGTTIRVTNLELANHTWTALDGAFDSGTLRRNDTFEFTFTEAGEFQFRCNFHPGTMTGTIVVTG
jgi:plastocyanin